MIGFTEIVGVALLGGPSAGKSTFLAGALHELDSVSKNRNIAMGVLDDSRSKFEEALQDLRNGTLPRKTSVTGNPAVMVEVQGSSAPRVLSLYDVAGESYGDDEAVRQLRFLEAASGLILLVDPLSLAQVAADHPDELAALRDSARPSPEHPMRVLERTLGAMSEAGVKPKDVPVAVVIVKSDALAIGRQVDELTRTAGEAAARVWLEQQGVGNFTRAVAQSFKSVGWFSATALGRTPDVSDNRAFAPSGTVAPLLWLLEQNGVAPARRAFEPAGAVEKL
jgi:hypothetical protein